MFEGKAGFGSKAVRARIVREHFVADRNTALEQNMRVFQPVLNGAVEEPADRLRVKKSGFWRHRTTTTANPFYILDANIIGNNRHLRFLFDNLGYAICEISFIFDAGR